MKETLFLKLQNEKAWFVPQGLSEGETLDHLANETVTGAYYGRGQDVENFHGTVADLLAWIKETRGDFFDLQTTLILSGVNLVSMQVNIPSKQARHVAQAVPFMLEDQVAQDIETLHIAIGKRQKDGDLPVLLCEKSRLEGLIECFSQSGIQLSAIFADMACLPAEEGAWHFLTDGKSLIARFGEKDALTVELDALPVLLNSLFADEDALPDVITVIISDDHMSQNLENWLKTQFTSHLADIDTDFRIEHSHLNQFQYLCEGVLNRSGNNEINLLQGEYQAVSERRPTLIKWKPVAVLASLFVVLFVGFHYMQAWKIESQTASIDQQTKFLYKRYFPRDKNLTNLKRRMQKKIAAMNTGGSGEGFLTLLAIVGEQLNELNRVGSPRLNPTRITYDQGQGDLKIDFIAGGFSDLDELKVKLEGMSLSVEIARASQEGDKMKARMNIRSAG